MNKNKKNDYRDILKSIIEQQKLKNSKHGQSYYAQKIGTSRSFLNLVFAKKKHLSYEKLDLLCRALKLSPVQCLGVLRSFLSGTTEQKYLTKSLNTYEVNYEMAMTHSQMNLEEMEKCDKTVLGSPIKSILIALCDKESSVPEIHEAIFDKSIDRQQVQENLAWLVENGYMQRKTVDGQNLYKSQEGFLKTDPSKLGVRKYLPWLQVIADGMNNPEIYRPGRIQSFTMSFDDKNLKELWDEYTRLSEKIMSLSEKSEKTKAVYIQNVMFTLASR